MVQISIKIRGVILSLPKEEKRFSEALKLAKNNKENVAENRINTIAKRYPLFSL
jgi:hypothetical protein